MVAAVGTFGVGAYALSQGVSSFDPSAFTAAYDQGARDKQKGYQANPTKTDADANRADDGDEKDAGADTDNTADVPAASQANVPAASASGTTAVRVTGDGSGTGVNVADGSGSSKGGTVISGPVISGDGGTGGTGAGDNGNGGNGGNNGGNQGGGSVTDPTDNSYRVLPQDPVQDSKDLNSAIGEKPVDESNEEIADLTGDKVTVRITANNVWGGSDTDLYIGQKLDAWTVFCALSARYTYQAEGEDYPRVYAWVCTKDEFPTYAYFKVTEFPDVVPSEDFTVAGRYRINDADTWHDWSVTYTPNESCTFVVSSKLDASGNRKILRRYNGEDVDMIDMTDDLLRDLGYIDEDGSLSHLLLGWKEGDTDIAIDDTYTPTPGRHVIVPGELVKVPQGVTATLKGIWTADFKYMILQTLTAVDDSTGIIEEKSGKRRLVVPEGIQNIDFESDSCLEVDSLKLSRTVLNVDTSGTCLRVSHAYEVSDDNPYYAVTDEGVLCSKDATEYYGVPAAMEKLTVGSEVTSVALPDENDLKEIIIQGTSPEHIPAIDLDKVSGCNIVIDDAIAGEFISAYAGDFTAASGNTVSLASRPNVILSVDRGVMSAGSSVAKVVDVGSSWAEIGTDGKKATRLGERCFAGNDMVDTVVLSGIGSYELADGCFADSAVSTVVCATQEQASYVKGRLAAAGAADADVVVLQQSKDGFSYYTVSGTDTDAETGAEEPWTSTTLWRAPSKLQDFYGTFTAADGSEVVPDNIASWAFCGCDKLEWVTTADDTAYIGSEAFKGCDAIEGLFIGCPGEVVVEQGAFSSCASMRFLASRAATCDVADDNEPNGSCLMYAPTGAAGYNGRFEAFTPESGVEDYSVIQQDDGGLVLCGSGENFGGAWLVLACGNELTGKVELPSTTVEIFSSAFANVGGSFTVNWDELPSLQWVDESAFAYSGLAGDVVLGNDWTYLVSVADSAFSSCAGITSVSSEASLINLGSGAFGFCTGLTKFSTASGKDWSGGSYIMSGAFYGCSALTEIEFSNGTPPNISVYDYGQEFMFDGEVSSDDDAERIHISVPEGCELSYIDAWIYPFMGYRDYDELYQAVYNDLLYNGRRSIAGQTKVPTEDEVKQEMIKRLTAVENRMRKMLGIPEVASTTVFSSVTKDGFTFDTRDGETTLAAVPRDATVIDLSDVAPEGVDSFIIPAGVFSKCTKLERIVLGDKVSAIKPGAFTGCDGVTVVLPAVDDDWDEARIELAGDEDETFDFGGDIKLEAPTGSVEKYLKSWPLGMAGHSSWGMYTYVMNVYWVLAENHDPDEITADMLNYSVNQPIFEKENKLRDMFGLPHVESYKDASSFYDASWYLEPWGDVGDGDLPEFVDGEDYLGGPDESAQSGEAGSESADAGDGTGDGDVGTDGADGASGISPTRAADGAAAAKQA